MPSKAPPTAAPAAAQLTQLGLRIRSRRKSLGLSAHTAAEAAAMSRVTFHRIEAGEPSVTMGAYMNAIVALGISIEATDAATPVGQEHSKGPADAVPLHIALDDYPELKRLAWHARGLKTLTPQEAFNIYERNGRHLDWPSMSEDEHALLQALIKQFGKGHLLV